MDDAEAPPAAGRVKRLASNNVAAVIAAAGPARRESPVASTPPADGAVVAQASPELPSLAMPALASAGVEARVSPAAPGGGAARQPKPAAKKAARLSDASAGSDGSGGDSGKHGLGGKAASMRPTNNQLTYKVDMQWNHYTLPLAPAVRATLRDSTEQCASVTTAFLQVIAALCDAEGGRPGGGRNILALLAANTRRTKVVSLATGTHRVPDELRRHTLTDADGVQYSTNLDRNRYGADTQYLNTVLRHDLAALGLCPHLLTVVIHDAKKRGALALPADAPCCCAAAAARGPLPPPASLFGNAPAPGSAPAQHAMPPPPPSCGSAPRGAVTMGGIGLLLDALAACGYKPPPSPFASGKMGAAQQATATAYAAAAFAGVNAAAAVVHGASAGGARPQRAVVPFGAASPGGAAAAQALAAAQAVAPAGAPRRRLLPLMSPGSVPPAEASAAPEASEESLDASGSAGGAGDENMAADDDVAAATRDAEAAAPHADDPQAMAMPFDAACAAPLRRRRTAPGAEAALAAAEARAAAAEDAAKALAAELAQMRAALAVASSQRNAPLPMLPPPPPSASPAPAAAAAPASVLGKQAREGGNGGGAFANVPKRPRGLTGRLGASPPTPAAGAASAAALRAAALQSPPVALKSEEATAVAAATAQ